MLRNKKIARNTLKQSMVILAILAVIAPSSGLAKPPPSPEHVCVREFFGEGGGVNPCQQQGGLFVKVVNAESPDDPGSYICTKAYDESYCETAPREFKHVETLDHESICTTDFHQPGVGEYCYSSPKIFRWARLIP